MDTNEMEGSVDQDKSMSVEVVEVNEEENPVKEKNGENANNSENAGNGDIDEKEDDDDGSGSEVEYEIECILDAKRGYYPEGRMGYFVKWKGFPNSENSWVDEQDAGNATQLIADYWERQSKKKSPKKGRTSDANSLRRKRGRKSNQAESESGDDEGAKKSRITKKQRNSTTEKGVDISSDDEGDFCDLSTYMKHPDWEPYVKSIDTMERKDHDILVYFTLKSGEHARESDKICRHRFPQMMIDFYRSNLRWKTAEEMAVEEH